MEQSLSAIGKDHEPNFVIYQMIKELDHMIEPRIDDATMLVPMRHIPSEVLHRVGLSQHNFYNYL